MYQTKIGLKALIILFVASAMSCNPPKNIHHSDPNKNNAEESPSILFLDYQVSRDSTKSFYDAQLINMTMVKGTIKDSQTNSARAEKDDLELLVLDNKHQTISQHLIPNPLDRSVEYVNDAGQFERKMIHLDSAQFSVRLQIESSARSIVLNRIHGEEQEATILLKTIIR